MSWREVGVPARGDRARLHRHAGAAVQAEALAHDDVGAGQRRGGIAHALGEPRGDVAVGVHARRRRARSASSSEATAGSGSYSTCSASSASAAAAALSATTSATGWPA